MTDKVKLVYKARLAEQTERFTDMVSYMKAVAERNEPLTAEERNLFSVAYKNVVGAKRSSWRILSSLEAKGDSMVDMIKSYREEVETELNAVCGEVLSVIEEHLIPTAKSQDSPAEMLVFLYKMVGDYNRYLAEVHVDKKKYGDNALEAYKVAQEKGAELPATHPISLGLALNYSVFHYEIRNDSKEACKLAKTAFDKAIADLETLSEDSYKDSTLIMQLLRDNLTLWTADTEGDIDEDPDVES